MSVFPDCLRLLFPSPLNLGPGKIRLLASIHATGSISAAARQLKISYRRAWLMVDNMNKAFPSPLLDTCAGGAKGGGTRLTELGEQVLNRYQVMLAKAGAAIADDIGYFLDGLAAPGGAAAATCDLSPRPATRNPGSEEAPA